MSDIFREIDEDLRRDRIAAFARRYGGLVAGVVLAAVIGVGGWRYMEYRAAQQADEAGARFATALKQLGESGSGAEGLRALEALAQNGPGGYAALARFRLASATAQKDRAAGIAAFDALAGDTGLEPGLRDFARMRAALLAVDVATPDEIASRVQGLAQPGNPWRNQARELIGLAWLKAGKLAEAEQQFLQVAVDAEAPQALRRRAQLFLELAAAGPVAVIPAAAPAPAASAATPADSTSSGTSGAAGAGAPATQN